MGTFKLFGILSLLIASAVIILLASGKLYSKNTGDSPKSLIETGLETKKEAEFLKGGIEKQQREIDGIINE